MGVMTNRPALRWAVPGAVVAIVIGAASIGAVTANASPTLPDKTAAELLVDIQSADPAGFSGSVVQSAELGLPELPVQIGGQGSSNFSSLVSGTHTLRVWYAGADQQRLALQGTLGESDIIRNGADVWTWSSDDNSATHFQLPDRSDDAVPVPDPGAAAMTPQQVADLALSAIDPSTVVSTDGTAEVADRAAYELVLAPRDTASLIGQIRIAIDAEQHVPLRVQVFAADAQTPAFEVGFEAISFDVPGVEQFTFTPPPGATVTESTLGQGGDDTDAPPMAELHPGTVDPGVDPVGEPQVIGTGWTSVVQVSLPTPDPTVSAPEGAGPAGPAAELGGILQSLPEVSGDWGSGRLLQSALFSVLLTDDGRVLGGAVAPEVLYQAAAQ